MAVKRIKIPAIYGGIDEKTPAHLLGDKAVQQADNFIIDSPLSMRKAYTVSDHSLQTYVAATFDEVISIHGPYYTKNSLDTTTYYENTGGYYILLFGEVGGSYLLKLVYLNNTTWRDTQNDDTTDLIEGISDSITFTVNSDFETTQLGNRVIIVDGVNRPMYIYFDPDGEIYSGYCGIPAPKNKPTIDFDETNYTSENFTTNSDGGYATKPGLVQILYTVVTEEGEESNPSPISLTADMQFFRYTDEAELSQWISNIIVQNLEIPSNISDDIKNDLKYFNIYARVFEYSEGITPKSFEFAKRVLIQDKGSTNSYSLSVEFDSSLSPDYENDVPKVAYHVGSIGGITAYGDIVKSNYELPFDFKYVSKIIVTNSNNINYVDALIGIQLNEADIDNFDVSDFLSGGSLANLNYIRIYDEDLTTPLPVFVKEFDESDGYINLFVKIPQLSPGGTHVLYLCFTPIADQSDYPGVNVVDYQAFAYGEFFEYGVDTWTDQIYFDPIRVKSSTDKICAPGLGGLGDRVINKADMNMTTRSVYYGINEDNEEFPIILNATDLIDGWIKHKGDAETGIIFDQNIDIPYERSEVNFTLSTYFKVINASSQATMATIFALWESASDYLSISYKKATSELILYEYIGGSGTELLNLEIPSADDTYFIVASVSSKDRMACIVAVSITTSNIYVNSTDSLNITEDDTVLLDTLVMGNPPGIISPAVGSGWYVSQNYAQTSFIVDKYINADSVTGMNEILYLLSFLPEMSNPVGINFFNDLELTNDDFSDGETGWTFSGTGSHSESGGIEHLDCDAGSWANASNDDSVTAYDGQMFIAKIRYKATGDINYIKLYLFDQAIELPDASDYIEHYVILKVVDAASYSYSYDMNVQLVANAGVDADMYIDYIHLYDITQNNNISFEDTVEMETKRDDHLFVWTKVNQMAAPDLYFKYVNSPIEKIVPAPSFLQMEYQNTFLIFTKNTVYRFVLSGSPDQWSASTISLIEEKRGYGLFAPESLVRLDDMLFWLSEAGVILWDKSGLRNISDGRLDFDVDEDAIGVYNPDNGEYIIQV